MLCFTLRPIYLRIKNPTRNSVVVQLILIVKYHKRGKAGRSLVPFEGAQSGVVDVL
jgi:hypothetical protein